MATVVIIPGGFHPFHAGHLALIQSAQRAFPDAEVYVAATNDTSARPFPFSVKEKLAKLAGVESGHFIQVKSPFRAEEITSRFDPKTDNLIFVRSEKDADKPPQAGGVKRDGSAAYLQPLLGAKKLEPFSKHAYMAYLPTVEFGPGMTSATEIRTAWPTLNEKRKTALVMSLYPRTQGNAKLANTVVKLLDAAIGTQDVAEGLTEYKNTPLQDYNGLQFMIDSNHPYLRVEAFAPGSGQQLAQVDFKIDDQDELHPEDLHVEERWRGQGIAQIMYDFVKSKGYTIHRSWSQTDAGSEFWNKHRGQKRVWEQGVAEGTTVTRIDSKPITDFLSSLKAYKHTDDWSQSGVDTGDDSYWKNKNLKTNTTKGLFAGDPKRTALYATGNAHETRYVEFTQDGQPIVYFDRKDLPAMRSRKTYLTVFDASDFRQLPTGEWFSQNPGKPIKQVPIGDPFKYIASQGWIVRVTDDLDKVFKQVKNMHKAGKIVQYGAEGMNESKQGVAENFADGRNPQDKGDAKRHGINTKASVSSLRKTAKQGGRKGQLAHWLANMKSGRAKKEDVAEELQHNPVDENQGWAATLEDQDYIEEKWSQKYKSSINCANPQGFSQKAHCAGRKK